MKKILPVNDNHRMSHEQCTQVSISSVCNSGDIEPLENVNTGFPVGYTYLIFILWSLAKIKNKNAMDKEKNAILMILLSSPQS